MKTAHLLTFFTSLSSFSLLLSFLAQNTKFSLLLQAKRTAGSMFPFLWHPQIHFHKPGHAPVPAAASLISEQKFCGGANISV